MSILGSIINTIFNHPVAQGEPSQAPGAKPASPSQERRVPRDPPPSPAQQSPLDARAGGPPVDIDAVMNALVAERGEKLNWKDSVVDLLKALGLDSSYDARVRLAQELHAPTDLIRKDSSGMNIWLHDAVLRAIQHNGGKLPDDLRVR